MWTVFLDRDGVINRKREGDYVKSWKEFEFLPQAAEAIALLKRNGFSVIVVTNQRGVSLGRLSEHDLRAIHDGMQAELGKADAALHAIYYCPHAHDACDCRKPRVGMFLAARRDFPEVDFNRSFMIGDSMIDMQAAARLGIRKVFISQNGAKLASAMAGKGIAVDFWAASLREAVVQYLVRVAGTDVRTAR